MSRRTIACMLCAVLAIGGLRWWLRGAEPPDPSHGAGGPARLLAALAGDDRRDGHPTCEIERDQRLAFTVSLETSYKLATGLVGAGAAARWHELALSGRILMRGVDHDVVAAVLVQPRVQRDTAQASAEPALEQPILFKLDARCRITGFAHLPEISSAARNQWQILLKMIEFDLGSERAATWQTEQDDSIGRYMAHYTRHVEGSDILVDRQRTRYRSVRSPGPVDRPQADVMSSRARARWRRGATFFSSASVRDHVRLTVHGRLLSEGKGQLALDAISPVPPHEWFATPIDAARFAWLSGDALAQASDLAYERDPVAPGLADRSLAAVLDDVARVLHTKSDASNRDAVRLLVQYLRARSGAAGELMTALRAHQIADDNLQSMVFLGLELAGTRDARDALVAGMDDAALGLTNRLRSIVALRDVPRPDRAVVDALARAAHAPGAGDEASQLRSTALLGLGGLRGRAELGAMEQAKVDSILRGALSDAITEATSAAVNGTDSSNDALGALGAAGNSGDPSLKDQVTRFLDHPSPAIQAEAYLALAKIDSRPPDDQLLDALVRSEPGGDVQRAISRVITEHQDARDDGVLERAIASLTMSQPEPVRATLIQILGPAAADHPRCRAALIAHFHVETSPKLLSLIGRYVGAHELS